MPQLSMNYGALVGEIHPRSQSPPCTSFIIPSSLPLSILRCCCCCDCWLSCGSLRLLVYRPGSGRFRDRAARWSFCASVFEWRRDFTTLTRMVRLLD
uniref:Uncharacterized protein n=1 Tax=Physcomitrium patens TaxID=3218 RepID=A0A2K1KTU7_PHYPA|nr:hypothetical protein PHYPA_004169 [Physcomitrium patens]